MKKVLIWAVVILLGIGMIGSCAAGDTKTDQETTIEATDNVVFTEETTQATTEATTQPTEESTEAPTQKPTSAPVPIEKETQASNENADFMVWIPQSGKKYHSNASCSGMNNPSKVTQEEAEEMGYTPCKKCF